MNRMQRKFFLVSAGAHGLLLVLLIVGPAFMPKRKSPLEQDLPVLHVIPSELVMAAAYGGGPPAAAPEPSTPQPARPEPSKPKPAPVKEVERPRAERPEPTVSKPNPPEPVRPREVESRPKPKPKPKTIEVQSTALQTREKDDAARARERAVAEERRRATAAAETIQARVTQTAESIKRNASGSTEISISGTGGPAFASYRQAIQTMCYRLWTPKGTSRGSGSEVLVEIVVHHDGRLVRYRILKSSGQRALDDSVRAALERVQAEGLPPFPPEMRTQGELQKSFRINFDLESKLSVG